MTAKVPITDNSNYTEDTTPKFDFDATKRGLSVATSNNDVHFVAG